MFETIVWATDGSDAADHALPYVQGLARVHGATVLVVHSREMLVGRVISGRGIWSRSTK